MLKIESEIVRLGNFYKINSYLLVYIFNESFLEKYRSYYNARRCLLYQPNLSLDFCVRNLYGEDVKLNDLVYYFRGKYTIEDILRKIVIE